MGRWVDRQVFKTHATSRRVASIEGLAPYVPRVAHEDEGRHLRRRRRGDEGRLIRREAAPVWAAAEGVVHNLCALR